MYVCVCVCVYRYISPGGGHGNAFQYSCLGNPRDRGAWWATVDGVIKSQTRLKQLSTHTHSYMYIYIYIQFHSIVTYTWIYEAIITIWILNIPLLQRPPSGYPPLLFLLLCYSLTLSLSPPFLTSCNHYMFSTILSL